MGNNHSFSIKHYFEIVEKLKKTHILSRFTENEPADKARLFLRHDIDYSPKAALKLAQEEEERGIIATYFVLLESPFYNPFEQENLKAIKEIKKRGHSIGLHFATEETKKEKIEQDFIPKFEILQKMVQTDKVVSFHFAKQEVYHSNVEFENYLNAYGPTFFLQGSDYISDSNQKWKKGCPCQQEFDKGRNLQMNTHPLWWVYDSENAEEILQQVLNEEVEKRKKIMESALPGSKF